MMTETCDSSNQGDWSLPAPIVPQAPVMPGSMDRTAVREKAGESPVPGISESTSPPEQAAQITSAAELVRLLRGAGLSKVAAKAVASGGWKGLQALSDGAPPENEITALREALDAMRATLEESDKNGLR